MKRSLILSCLQNAINRRMKRSFYYENERLYRIGSYSHFVYRDLYYNGSDMWVESHTNCIWNPFLDRGAIVNRIGIDL